MRTYYSLRQKLSLLKQWATGYIKGLMIELAGVPPHGIHVFFGENLVPAASEKVVKGGVIKVQRLNEFFPNTSRRFNVFYMVSSKYPLYAEQMQRSARRKGAKIVWNQDGVAYPAWMPSGWEDANVRMAQFLHDADYVFYQSEFAKICADQFLGNRKGQSEILYNAVDTAEFRPAKNKKLSSGLTLLVMGSQYHNYPLKSAIRTLACIQKTCLKTRIVIAGKVWDHVLKPLNQLISDLHLQDNVTFLPPFLQKEAVQVFHQCDILLHTKIQDVCPGIVIEAMASGLPVVYSISGGVPELVGDEAGMGVPTTACWEKRVSPPPEAWAEAVLTVAEKHQYCSAASRQRAVERFDLKPWVERHRQVFSELLEG